jgi:hypothetical protein
MKSNSYANMLLWVIQEAKYDYNNIQKLIKINVESCEQRIREIEAMSQEDFLKEVSKSIFGVGLKDYYIDKLKKRIETLKDLPSVVDHLLEMWKSEKWLLNDTLKYAYKGYVRPMKEAIEKLAQSRFNSKLPSFSHG